MIDPRCDMETLRGRATALHYFVANEWPIRIWAGVWVSGAIALAAVTFWPLLVHPLSWGDPLRFVLCIVLAGGVGYFGSLLPGWVIMSSFYHSRSMANGEPFAVGDMVQILVGPDRDRIVPVVKVYNMGDRTGSHRVHVELGTEDGYGENVFSSFQVLRIVSAWRLRHPNGRHDHGGHPESDPEGEGLPAGGAQNVAVD